MENIGQKYFKKNSVVRNQNKLAPKGVHSKDVLLRANDAVFLQVYLMKYIFLFHKIYRIV
ncbi:hypothetical protein DP113_14205 [Brasilonema octagenarum UFV-E1]|nr:hypothetical protein [Brasilonema octagenarum UFV-OR1]QDL15266.1 hypothetical protein DP113_14205 [Brasilonema octagenarum UFV-E1]